MNLASEITAAQTAARRDGDRDYRDVTARDVLAKLPAEARAAYERLGLAVELLTLPVSQIRMYAERAGADF